MTTDTPGVDLDAIRKRLDNATPGPWTARNTYPHIVLQGDDEDAPSIISTTLAGNVVADAEFIARARTDVPDLLDIAEAARYEYGDRPCVEGECECASEVDDNAPEDAPCPLVVTRYATADDVIERDKLRAEMELYRDAILHMLALAPDEYRQTITAARAAGSSEDYAKNNGRAEMIRIFAAGLAERAGLPVTDWEQIKQSIPTDGVYRAAEVAR